MIRVCSRNSIRTFILGIETSCDDTGVAIVDLKGRLVSEALRSQTSTRHGGVLPGYAMNQHAKYLPELTKHVLSDAGLHSPEELNAIAVTNRPGLKGSLCMGVDYAKYLCFKHRVPLLPIHHMEAHALTPRMIFPDLTFPYLFLLISGGHCLLGLARDLGDFLMFGKSRGSAPGECFDKVARALKLNSHWILNSGGGAIESTAALGGDPEAFPMPIPLAHYRDCNFSFSGLKASCLRKAKAIVDEPRKIPNFCASVQYGITKHLCMRVQRALVYAEAEKISKNRFLVVSGGVARNREIRRCLDLVCESFGYKTFYPPLKYCTDNGVMIAWNGLEKYRRMSDLVPPNRVFEVDISPRAPLGVDVSQGITEKNIKCDWIPLL